LNPRSFIRFFILKNKTNAGNVNWWGSKSKEFRLWVFYSVVWMIAVLFYVIAFDPYGRMYEDDYLHMIFIMLSPPLLIGIARLVYNRWIK